MGERRGKSRASFQILCMMDGMNIESIDECAVSWLLGAEKLFVNEQTITIPEMSVAGNGDARNTPSVAYGASPLSEGA